MSSLIKLCIDSGGTKIKYGVFKNKSLLYENTIYENGSILVNKDNVFKIYESLIEKTQPNCVLIGAAGIINCSGEIEKLKQKFSNIEIAFIPDVFLIGYKNIESDNELIGVLGTGSAFVYRKKGDIKLLGGAGHILGDHGSGYRFALEFLKEYLFQLEIDGNKEFISEIEKIYNISSRRDVIDMAYNFPKQAISDKTKDLLNMNSEIKYLVIDKVINELVNEVSKYKQEFGFTKIKFTGSIIENEYVRNSIIEKTNAHILENSLIEGINNYMFNKDILRLTNLMLLDFRMFNGKPVLELNDELEEFIEKFQPYGIILFADNFVNIEQGKKLIDQFRKCKEDLVITIDQEGGIVTRIAGATNFNGNMCLGATNKEAYAFDTGLQIGKELNALGIDINFAPVVDINTNPKNPVINIRSFGKNKEFVSRFGNSYSDGLNSGGVLSCFKHFPGHGDVDCDSHIELPTLNKSFDELMDEEMYPFINSNSNIFMSAHIALPQIDNSYIKGTDKNIPFTMSKLAIDTLLKPINKDIILISDAMNMRAIRDYYSESESFIECIESGIDIVCMPFIIDTSEKLLNFEQNLNSIVVTDENRIEVANNKAAMLKSQCHKKIHNIDVFGNKELENQIARDGVCRDKNTLTNSKYKVLSNSEFDVNIKNNIPESFTLTNDISLIDEVDIVIFDSINKDQSFIDAINNSSGKIIIHIRDPFSSILFDSKNDNVYTFGFVRRNNGPDSESGGNVQELVNFKVAFELVINNEEFIGNLSNIL